MRDRHFVPFLHHQYGSQQLKITVKVNSEYASVKDYVAPEPIRKAVDGAAANPLAGKGVREAMRPSPKSSAAHGT